MSDCVGYKNFKLTVVSATDVENVRKVFSTRVYATVTILGDDKVIKRKTPTDKFNGTNPQWNCTMEYTIASTDVENPGLDLLIELYIGRKRGDKRVGYASWPIYKLFHHASANNNNIQGGGVTRLTSPLETDGGVRKGVVAIEYSFGEEKIVKKLSWKKKLLYALISVVVIAAIVSFIRESPGPNIVSSKARRGGGISCEGTSILEEGEREEEKDEAMNGEFCDSSIKSQVRTVWTPQNPGRRIRTCENIENGCEFFVWVDPPMCARSKTVILALLKKLNTYEVEEKKYKPREKIMLFVTLVSWLILLGGFIKPANCGSTGMKFYFD